MRPVDTWKSTEARTTPMSDGPRPVTPSRFAPWQVIQLTLKICLPAATSVALAVPAAPDELANIAKAPPIAAKATARTPTPASRRRQLRGLRDFLRPHPASGSAPETGTAGV